MNYSIIDRATFYQLISSQIDSSGTPLWKRTYTSNYNLSNYSILQESDSTYLSSGYINNTSNKSEQFLGKIKAQPIITNIIQPTYAFNCNIYPNPSNGYFSVEIPFDTYQVEITNYFGQLINKLNVGPLSTFDFYLPENGIYFIIFKNKLSTFTNKIVITK